MSRYHALMQGEGRRPDATWFGFYAGRQVDAATVEEATALALASMAQD